MYKTALFTTLSLLSALNPVWGARVVVTQVHTVVVDGNAPAQTSPPVQVNNANFAKEVDGKVVVPAPTSIAVAPAPTTYANAPIVKPSSSSSAKSSTSSTKGAAAPSSTGSTGGGYGGGAYGKATVRNNCGFDIQMAPVYGQDTSRGTVTIKKGDSWSDPIQPFNGGHGGVFKVTANGQEVVQFEYTTVPDKGELWYDISYVDCAHHTQDASKCSFWQKGHAIRLPKSCRQVWCQPGTFCPTEAYYIETYAKNTLGFTTKDALGKLVDILDPNYKCTLGADIEYVMCATTSQSPLKRKRSIAGRLEIEEDY